MAGTFSLMNVCLYKDCLNKRTGINYHRALLKVPKLLAKSCQAIELAHIFFPFRNKRTLGLEDISRKSPQQSSCIINNGLTGRIEYQVIKPPFYLIRELEELRSDVKLGLSVEPSLPGYRTIGLGK